MTSHSDVSSKSFNPWLTEDRNIDALKSLLRSADASGLLKLSSDEEDHVVLGKLRESSSSLLLIQRLREISQKRNELEKVNLIIQKRLMDKETRDITHLSGLENKIAKIKDLNSHLNAILENKKQLTTRLQQPMVGIHIKVEAKYHGYLTELFHMVALHLTELHKNLQSIEWSNQLNINEDDLEEILGDISGKLAQIQTGLQKILQMRKVLHHFQGQRDNSSQLKLFQTRPET